MLFLDEPYDDLWHAAARRFGLDAEALIGIARAAVAAPHREVTLHVGARAAAEPGRLGRREPRARPSRPAVAGAHATADPRTLAA